MPAPDEVSVLIPTLDEAETIGEVVEGFRSRGFDNVLVGDGGSTDGTPEITRERGARVVEQTQSGKGQAIREAFDYVDAEYVLMLDGDPCGAVPLEVQMPYPREGAGEDLQRTRVLEQRSIKALADGHL